MSDVTRILSRIDNGDSHAANELLPLVYGELRKLAAVQMANEKPGQTLQATALVHEAYLRLIGDREQETGDGGSRWEGSRHFFAAAAEAMRRILVENARRKGSLKRGGHLQRQALDVVAAAESAHADELLALDEALPKLAAADPLAAQLVQLRYFAGLTMDQAAETLGISPRTAYYTWNYARSWLHKAVCGESQETAELRRP